MIIPFSQIGSVPPPPADPFADAADGASVAGDSSEWLASDNATAALRPAYNFHDLSTLDPSSEILAAVAMDDNKVTFNLTSFSFPYYSNTPTGPHTAIQIGSNGYIFFGANPANWLPTTWTPASSGSSNTFPHADGPNYCIAALMKDYGVFHIYAKEITTVGQKRLIVQWDVQDIYNAARDVFQCVLREDGSIYFYYDSLLSDVSGDNNTTAGTGVGYDVSPFRYGCQNGNHTAGVMIGGSNPTQNLGLVGKLLVDGLAIRIKPPV
jgi:hypothetical protein